MILLIIVVLLTVIFYYFSTNKKKHFPPGPRGLPYFGNLFSIGAEPHIFCTKMAKKYGPIFSINNVGIEGIVLNGAQIIKESGAEPAFAGMFHVPALEFMTGKEGILRNEGASWAELRRFTLRHLRDFGFGKQSLEGVIMEEVNELVEWIKQLNGQPVDLHPRFRLAVLNSLWIIVTGQRFDHDDDKLTQIMNDMDASLRFLVSGKLKSLFIMFFPNFSQAFPNFSGWNGLKKASEPKKQLLARTIEEHKKTYQAGHIRDFIDVFLQEVYSTKDPNSSFHETNAVKSLPAVVSDFFFAGSDTTSASLTWAVLYLIHYPEVQTKLQEELDRVVGSDRKPSFTDRNNLPYAEAFILELLRKSSIIKISAQHALLDDVTFHGYQLPKGTSVLANLDSLHHDPSIWGDPENFRPERFLDSNGLLSNKRPDALLPFFTGKRECPGQTFAKDELFLFVTNLAQTFHITQEEGKSKPSMDCEPGVFPALPVRYNVVMTPRFP